MCNTQVYIIPQWHIYNNAKISTDSSKFAPVINECMNLSYLKM